MNSPIRDHSLGQTQLAFDRVRGRARYLRWETIAGVVIEFSTSIITISVTRILQHLKSSLPEAINTTNIKRVYFLVVYVSVVLEEAEYPIDEILRVLQLDNSLFVYFTSAS
ncbi:hypothetical protein GQ457_03G022320 [Hibiscus cannabinus]